MCPSNNLEVSKKLYFLNLDLASGPVEKFVTDVKTVR